MATKHPSSFEALEKAILSFGSLTEMAKALGLSSYTVIQQWRYSGRVPPEHCPRIEQLTQGAVRCEQLNDRVDWAYLRQSASPEPHKPRLRASPSAHKESAKGENTSDGAMEAAA